MSARYTADTSFLNDFLQADRPYDRLAFRDQWEFIEHHIETGDIISHVEVMREMKNSGIPHIIAWVRKNRKMFLDYELPKDAEVVAEIGKKQSEFLHQGKTSAIHADPWLIAQAKNKSLILLTSESDQSPKKIPQVAKSFGVESQNVVTFFKSQSIGFEEYKKMLLGNSE